MEFSRQEYWSGLPFPSPEYIVYLYLNILPVPQTQDMQIDGETVEIVRNFILGGFKITADDDCSHEIKGDLFLGRKIMTHLDSIFGEGNGNPVQYSCLENPMDGGAC